MEEEEELEDEEDEEEDTNNPEQRRMILADSKRGRLTHYTSLDQGCSYSTHRHQSEA